MIVHPPEYEIGLAKADLTQNKVIKKNQLKNSLFIIFS
tara:strand:+ start:31 stop:144 length:114 start_codon:yes stop_codon:yes gene_type:complete